ncbi:MAG TPA: IclR family transcriptional regulator [Bradyrhizobium sp.]|nr:IclR family transcriptional regulator [Bradyrhizobium sp.]
MLQARAAEPLGVGLAAGRADKKVVRSLSRADRRQIGVQSVEIAGRLLKTLAQLGGPQTLKDFSAVAGLSPAKAHRYLVSLIREGLIEQSAIDGRYDFGGAAREIGRAAINRLDIMRIGAPLLVDLRNVLQQTVFLGVWGNEGPTVLYWLDVPRPVSVIIRPGSILPLLTSALGLVCAAYLPPDLTKRRIAKEIAEHKRSGLDFAVKSEADAARKLADVRARGFSLVRGDLIRGIDAMAVPVLDFKKDLVAVLAAVGPSKSIDVSSNGKSIRELKLAAQKFVGLIG